VSVRKIIEIDEDLCNGCGNCIPNCPEGALQIIDGKARLISDLFCDGLGACIGECPIDAIRVVEREAELYNETVVMANITKAGINTIIAHLKHLKDHGETKLYGEAMDYLKNNNIDNLLDKVKEERMETGEQNRMETEERLPCGCPSSRVMDLRVEDQCEGPVTAVETNTVVKTETTAFKDAKSAKIEQLLKELTVKESKLRQWPVQIMLVPPTAPYLNSSDLLIAADCVPFAYPNFHEDMLEGKILLVGCPKLDDSEFYLKKFTDIFSQNDIHSVTVAHMEVPCCFGMMSIVKQAIEKSGKNIPVKDINISIRGKVIS
jgi:Pyruvate/2-oxoacid:ferredoxin oxidoreductase delta subunit